MVIKELKIELFKALLQVDVDTKDVTNKLSDDENVLLYWLAQDKDIKLFIANKVTAITKA
jgi:hypothetical protein